jgi:membrane associated rhomboid family serine protease
MTEVYRIKKRGNILKLNATLLFVALNVICFIIFGVISLFHLGFLDYTALKPANIVNHFYFWTFITSMFMHSGFFHLIANMFSLMFVGSFSEKILGKKRFILFYLGAGLFAGLLFVLISFIFPVDFNTYAVGASGALFGLIGLLMILTPNLPVYMMFIPIPIKMKFAAPTMLLFLWLISILGDIPIGNTAHLGGFIFGVAYGIYLKKHYKNKTRYIGSYFGGN